MTIEEKAKAYDNALKRIREFYLEYDNISNLIDVKRELESIFPQLCESEDEQTRRRLIDFIFNIKAISESGRTYWAIRKEDAEMCNAFLAYLEKQKEQKPADEQFPPLEGLDAIKAKYYDDGFKNGFDEGVESVKPAEWSEEDKKVYSRLLNHYESLTHCVTTADRHQEIREELNFLKSLRPKSKEELAKMLQDEYNKGKEEGERIGHTKGYNKGYKDAEEAYNKAVSYHQ